MRHGVGWVIVVLSGAWAGICDVWVGRVVGCGGRVLRIVVKCVLWVVVSSVGALVIVQGTGWRWGYSWGDRIIGFRKL